MTSSLPRKCSTELSYMSLALSLSNKTLPTIFVNVLANYRKHVALLLERAAGIEPASSAWKAEVLPLNYAREKQI